MKKLVSFLHYLANRPFWILGGFTIIGLLATAPVAMAQAEIGQDSTGLMGNMLNSLFGTNNLIKGLFGLIFVVIGTIASALSNLFILIINTIILPGQNSLFFGTGTQPTVIKQAFDAMLGIANTLFFVVLVVFAIMIITRQAGYNFKKAITALITAIVLANLSYPLVQVLIELGDSLRNSGTLLFGGAMDAGALQAWFQQIGDMAKFVFDPSLSTTKYIMLSFSLMAVQCILAYAFFRLTFVLVERAIRLVGLTIFAPIQAVLGILPQKDLQFGGSWFSDVIKWVMVLPVVFILIGIAKQILPSTSPDELKNLLQNVWPDQAAAGTSTPTIAGFAFQLIIGLGIMIAATNAPSLLKLPVSAATKFFTDSISGGGVIGKAFKTEATARLKDAGYKAMKSSALTSGLYNKVAGSIAARRDQIEGQTAQRKLNTDEQAAKITQSRFLTKQSKLDITIKNELDNQARLEGYGSFDEWKDDDKADKDKRDSIEKRIKDKNKTTPLGLEVGATETEYMTLLGKASAKEFDLGKTPEETLRAYKEAKAKWEKSDRKDFNAAFDMQKFFDVLKKQALRLTGEPGKQAASYRNDLVESDGDLLLNQAGLPKKFGIATVQKEEDKDHIKTTDKDYTEQARASERLQTTQVKLETTSKIVRDPAVGGSTSLDLKLKQSNEGVLKLVTHPTDGANVRASLHQIKSDASINQVITLTSGKNKTILGEIQRIQQSATLNETEKKQTIDDLLEKNGFINTTNPTAKNDRAYIAESLARKVNVSDLGQAKVIADAIEGSNPALSQGVTDQIQAILEQAQAKTAHDAINAKIDSSISSSPQAQAYQEAVKVITNPAAPKIDPVKDNATYLRDVIDEQIRILDKAIVANAKPDGSDGAALNVHRLDPSLEHLGAELVNRGGLHTLKPNADIKTDAGFGKNVSGADYKKMLLSLRNAQTNPRI